MDKLSMKTVSITELNETYTTELVNGCRQRVHNIAGRPDDVLA